MNARDLQENSFWNRLVRKANGIFVERFGRRNVHTGRTLGVGIVGAGNVVRWKYIPQIHSRPYLRPQFVYDLDAGASQQAAHALHCRAATHFDELLQDKSVEAIFICTPPSTHAELALEALAAGKHVLCEKPMAFNLEQAQAMYLGAQESRTVHMVHFTFRFTPEGTLVHRIIRSGLLGRLYNAWGNFSQGGWLDQDQHPARERVDAAAWRYGQGGGILTEMGSHLIDFCRWCFGEVSDVRSWSQTFRSEKDASEDLSGFTLFFDNECVAQLEVSRIATGYRERNFLEVYGSRGSLRLDQGGVHLWTRDVPRWRQLLLPKVPNGEFLDLFYQAIVEPRHSLIIPTFADGLKNNEILEAITRNAEWHTPNSKAHG